MDDLIAQIRAATDAGLYYFALMGALMLPDICGALNSENGRASAPKFKEWLKANVPEQATQATLIYGLRCSLLHQGGMLPHGGHFPIACTFPHPSVPQFHNLSTEVGATGSAGSVFRCSWTRSREVQRRGSRSAATRRG